MATQWLRLWHETPNDPKFRVVAKVSNQPLYLVIALYVTLLVDASQNELSRGVTLCHNEELAVTLDCDIAQVEQIKAAMQGRLLDGDKLSGWERRQPKREDQGDEERGVMSAAERKRAQRERERERRDLEAGTQGHDPSRNVTLDKEEDKDKDKKSEPSAPASQDADSSKDDKKRKPSIQFRTFLAGCKAAGVKPIPKSDTIYDWAEKANIPEQYLVLAWLEFKTRYAEKTKRYADWPAVFRNAVRDNWFKLWYLGEGGEIMLTSQGRLVEKMRADAEGGV